MNISSIWRRNVRLYVGWVHQSVHTSYLRWPISACGTETILVTVPPLKQRNRNLVACTWWANLSYRSAVKTTERIVVNIPFRCFASLETAERTVWLSVPLLFVAANGTETTITIYCYEYLWEADIYTEWLTGGRWVIGSRKNNCAHGILALVIVNQRWKA